MHMKFHLLSIAALLALSAHAAEPAADAPQENASNPLAKAKNTDIRVQTLDTEAGTINDIFIDGAFMANDKLKIKYELHYWETNITGKSYDGFESASLKAIYFVKEGQTEDYAYRWAVGSDWILDLGDSDKGIGFDSDQIAPFTGLAFGIKKTGTMVIPLVQHFVSYSGEDVSTTAARLIILQPLPEGYWVKLDAILPVEWENDENMPANAELQFGKNLNKDWALYTDLLAGIGGDKAFDWGLGLGVRFKY